MRYKYGTFSQSQFEKYKTKLHKNLFWLLLYKDPKTKDKYAGINFEAYIDGLLIKIDSLNELLFYPSEIVEITVLLQAAKQETQKEDFNYAAYRKLVLDAHALIDQIKDTEDL
jgi:hypothetical protein